jgi:cobalamin biosynthesis protein CobD/CbiB
MQKRKTLGAISFLIGVVLILNSLSGITGFVIAETIGTGISGIIGLVLVIGGLALFMGGRKSLMHLIGIHDYEEDKDYQKLKNKLRQEEVNNDPQSIQEAVLDHNIIQISSSALLLFLYFHIHKPY